MHPLKQKVCTALMLQTDATVTDVSATPPTPTAPVAPTVRLSRSKRYYAKNRVALLARRRAQRAAANGPRAKLLRSIRALAMKANRRGDAQIAALLSGMKHVITDATASTDDATGAAPCE